MNRKKKKKKNNNKNKISNETGLNREKMFKCLT